MDFGECCVTHVWFQYITYNPNLNLQPRFLLVTSRVIHGSS